MGSIITRQLSCLKTLKSTKTMGPIVGSVALLLSACDGSGVSSAPGQSAAVNPATQCAAFLGETIGPVTVQGASFVPATSAAPEYCQVTAAESGRPTFQMVALLPVNWNGGVVQSGGGGLDGLVPTSLSWDSGKPLNDGLAFIASNGGHDMPDPANSGAALANNPEGMLDYSYRSIGTTFDFGKAAISQFYGKPLEKSYFDGCSKGGTEAMMAASHYPDNYDGIVAQAPVPHLNGWITKVASYGALVPLTNDKWQAVYDAYVAQCDALDGIVDGIVSNPAACKFDATKLTFLSPDEIKTVQSVTSDLTLADGAVVYNKFGWGSQASFYGTLSLFSAMEYLGVQWMSYPILNSPNYNPASFNTDVGYGQIVAANQPYSVDVDPSAVAAFLKKGKKLLVFQGGDDGALSIEDNINFQKTVVAAAGASASNTQMYILPGVGHCGYQYSTLKGANSIGALSAMRSWVEQGQQPNGLVATRLGSDGSVQMTRPLCVQGTYPKYKGSGDVSKADSFSCVADGT